jgi:hypothetical protein
LFHISWVFGSCVTPTLRFACMGLIALRACRLSEAMRHRDIIIHRCTIPADDRRPESPTRKSTHHRIIVPPQQDPPATSARSARR